MKFLPICDATIIHRCLLLADVARQAKTTSTKVKLKLEQRERETKVIDTKGEGQGMEGVEQNTFRDLVKLWEKVRHLNDTEQQAKRKRGRTRRSPGSERNLLGRYTKE
ncbi:hypothetical protein WN51_05672 [Melipona quadrifasciata]|uniref:Uncharacterized protein n=1 Tax=Melipona quadrifasciata TaxID=166423 RepID=A0A0M9ACE6_9HYME|nr:hypothetical protein WN51_05672 [Melipona quadrifasciata]